MIFEYSAQKTFLQSLVVDDPGNMALRCDTEEGVEFYLITKTIMGKTIVLTSGPTLIDAPNIFLEKYNFNIVKFNYSEKQLSKVIKTFINDPIKKIAQIDEITVQEALQNLPNLVEGFYSL